MKKKKLVSEKDSTTKKTTKIKPVPVLLKIHRDSGHIQFPSISEAKEILKNISGFEKQTTAQINVHQKEMEKIANDMAVLFEQKITASNLAKWLVIANTHSDPHDNLIWNLGYIILPGLIEAKNQSDKINFLNKELPDTFSVYKTANTSLFQLGEGYFKKNKGLGFFIEEIEEFMSVYLTLLSICEMFENYEYHQKELEVESDKAA